MFTYCTKMDGRFENPQSLWQEMLYPITRQRWMDPDCKLFDNNTTLVGCSHVPYNSISAEHKIFWRQKVHTWTLVLNGPILQRRVANEPP